jgi:hypothetical protein
MRELQTDRRYGCTPAFMVVVKKIDNGNKSQQDPWVQLSLSKVFEAPSMATACAEVAP